jgi:hypothetical protein
MWLTLELFGVTVLRIGIGGPAEKQWVTHTDGNFELAPQVEEEVEWEEDEYRKFGFR